MGAADSIITTEKMAADSGYNSFSLSQGIHADDSLETSERSTSFDLEDSLAGLTRRVVQAIIDAGNVEFLPAGHKELMTPDPATPLTTSISGQARGFGTFHVSGKPNFSSKANVVDKVSASSGANVLSKPTASQKVNVSTKVGKRTIPRPRPATLAISGNDNHGQSMETLVTSLYLEPALAQHFRIMVNMVKHLNHALFHSDAKHGVQQYVMEEAKALSEEMIYFFDGLQKSFKVQLEKIEDTNDYLPILGDNVEEHHLEATIKIWTEKICECVITVHDYQGTRRAKLRYRNVKKPRKSEERLINTFAELYDAQVYQPFFQTRCQNAKHNIRELSVHLDSVYNAIEGAMEPYDQIVVEMEEFKQSVKRAFDDFCRLPGAWFEAWGLEKVMAKVEGRISEPTTPSVPSTPTVSTDAESNGEEEQSPIMPVSAKGKEKRARAAGLKREYTL